MSTAAHAPDEISKAGEVAGDPVEEASAASFPASDPPGWIPLHAGSPAPATAREANHSTMRQSASQAPVGRRPGRQPDHVSAR